MASSASPHPTNEVVVDENTKLSDLTDRQILELTQNIKHQDAIQRPLVGDMEDIDELRKEYEHGADVFLRKIGWMAKQGWGKVRRLRGDGNCFYRAFAFGFCEKVLQAKDPELEAKNALKKLEAVLPLLAQAGFQKDIYEDFYDPLRQIITSLQSHALTPDALKAAFNEQETSASIVVFLRLLTSGFLRANEQDFAPFLLAFEEDWERFPAGAPSLHEFCQHYVEAVDRDADHLSITALTRCLTAHLNVAYLDPSKTKEVDGVAEVDFIEFDGSGGET